MEKAEKITFEGGTVFLSQRTNGHWALRWREGGTWKRTTKAKRADAVEFARTLARTLGRNTGERWISAAEAEAVDVLRRGCREAGIDLGRIIIEVVAAVEILNGDIGGLRDAARYYMESGPGGVKDLDFYAALSAVRAEYDHSRGPTRNTMRVALDAMRRMIKNKKLSAVSHEDVELFVFEKGAAVRTSRNRISQAGTFFARCVALGYWPPTKPLPTSAIKKPRLEDKAPEIFTPEEGRKILEAVIQKCPRYVGYLVIAGWLGCRPSECLRLRWQDVDFEHGMMHLPAEAVGKTGRERWTAIDEKVAVWLKAARQFLKSEGNIVEGYDKICLTKSREEISKLARSIGMKWPADVLRHSAITYALQISGNDYGRTAERMGNSPAVIESNYRRPIPPGAGERWMNVLAEVTNQMRHDL